MDVKLILKWVSSLLGSALIAGAVAAWDVIKAKLAEGGADAFASGTVNGIVVYGVMVVAVFLGGWAVSKIPTKKEPVA